MVSTCPPTAARRPRGRGRQLSVKRNGQQPYELAENSSRRGIDFFLNPRRAGRREGRLSDPARAVPLHPGGGSLLETADRDCPHGDGALRLWKMRRADRQLPPRRPSWKPDASRANPLTTQTCIRSWKVPPTVWRPNRTRRRPNPSTIWSPSSPRPSSPMDTFTPRGFSKATKRRAGPARPLAERNGRLQRRRQP